MRTSPIARAATWLIPAILLIGASIVQARVFWRWAAHDQLAACLTSSGAKQVYAGSIVLNGGSGELSVFALGVPFDDALHALGNSGPSLQITRTGDGLALGVLREGANVSRLVLVQPPGTDTAVAFRIDQTEADFRQSAQPPSRAGIAGLPTLSGATPSFLAQDLRTGASFGVATAPVPVATALSTLDQQFASAGWQRLLPDPAASRRPGPAPSSAFQWYRSGDTLCAMLLTPSTDGSLTTITMLHKRQGME